MNPPDDTPQRREDCAELDDPGPGGAPCLECDGSGVDAEGGPCPHCDGSGSAEP